MKVNNGEAMIAIWDEGPCPPCPPRFNMAAHVLRHAEALDDKLALRILAQTKNEEYSYSALRRAVLGTGTGLLELGLSPGDKILLRLGNTVDFPISYLGAIAVGLIPVPTSSQLTVAEIDAIMQEIAPRGVIADPDLALPSVAPEHLVMRDQLRSFRDRPAAPFDMGDPDRLAYVIYTSGTSGRPRAVGHAHRAIWARQMMMRDWYDLRADDRILHAGAFNWTYTLGTGLMDPCSAGATALIPLPGTPPEKLGPLLRQSRASIFAAAPGVYRKILKSQDTLDLPHLRHGLSAGEKLSSPLRAAWRQATGRDVHEAFGMSECSTFISFCPTHPAPEDEAALLGRPQRGRRVAIVGPDGPVPRGAEGTIAISQGDPGLMLGYLNAPEETAARFQGEWFLTGDRGRMDDQGRIAYLGRADDMMNAGGYRVSPQEVEAAMLRHPDLQEVAAAEIEVKPGVRLIALYYVAANPLSESDLARHAAAHLARYKQPRQFHSLAALPRNANGKIVRKALTPS